MWFGKWEQEGAQNNYLEGNEGDFQRGGGQHGRNLRRGGGKQI